MPQSIIDFYSKHKPEELIEGGLWAVKCLVMENTSMTLGSAMTPHGIFVFASTFCGDTYGFDTITLDESRNPKIVLVSHEVIGEDSPKAKAIAANLTEFI